MPARAKIQGPRAAAASQVGVGVAVWVAVGVGPPAVGDGLSVGDGVSDGVGDSVAVGEVVAVAVFVRRVVAEVEEVAAEKIPPPPWPHDPVLSVAASRTTPGRIRTKFSTIVRAETRVAAPFAIAVRSSCRRYES